MASREDAAVKSSRLNSWASKSSPGASRACGKARSTTSACATPSAIRAPAAAPSRGVRISADVLERDPQSPRRSRHPPPRPPSARRALRRRASAASATPRRRPVSQKRSADRRRRAGPPPRARRAFTSQSARALDPPQLVPRSAHAFSREIEGGRVLAEEARSTADQLRMDFWRRRAARPHRRRASTFLAYDVEIVELRRSAKVRSRRRRCARHLGRRPIARVRRRCRDGRRSCTRPCRSRSIAWL